MRYSIEPRERRYVKGCGFLSFARNFGTYAAKVARNMSNKYSQKLIDTAADAIKTASKRAIQKTAEATGDLIGNKIADKITSASKNHKMKLIMKYLKRDIFLQKEDKRLLMN